mmetsp:Transcript_23653/g.48964  ORF Transcript_23653/g.48964 Transcript_23653/m.48964 type:complete len:88 (-) Transcript_23653:1037-1300(-)
MFILYLTNIAVYIAIAVDLYSIKSFRWRRMLCNEMIVSPRIITYNLPSPDRESNYADFVIVSKYTSNTGISQYIRTYAVIATLINLS